MNQNFINNLFEKLSKVREDLTDSTLKIKSSMTPPVRNKDYEENSSENLTPKENIRPKSEENVFTSSPNTNQSTPSITSQGGKNRPTKKSNLFTDETTTSQNDENATSNAFHASDSFGEGDKLSVKSSQNQQQGEKNSEKEIKVQAGDMDVSYQEIKDAIDQENLQIQVGDDWYVLSNNKLVALQEQSAQIAAQKAAQQAFYQVIEAHPPVSKVRRETLVPVQSVVAPFYCSYFTSC